MLALKVEIELGAVLSLHRDFLRLLAVLLLPRGNRVVAGRESLDLECAVLRGDREERVIEYRDVVLHPRMDVALHRERRPLRRIETLLLAVASRLRFVPLAVDLR